MKKIFAFLFAAIGLFAVCCEVAAEEHGYETDVFTTKSGKTVTFHALMHACIRIQVDGKEIEIDPVGKLGMRTVD